MILLTPALLKRVYNVGIAGYRLCAGALIEPRMVPPYVSEYFWNLEFCDGTFYLMVVATYIYENVVFYGSFCTGS